MKIDNPSNLVSFRSIFINPEFSWKLSWYSPPMKLSEGKLRFYPPLANKRVSMLSTLTSIEEKFHSVGNSLYLALYFIYLCQIPSSMVSKQEFFASKGFISNTPTHVQSLEDTVDALERDMCVSLAPFLPPSAYSPRFASIKSGTKISLDPRRLPRKQFTSIPSRCTGYSWLTNGKRNLATLDQCIQGAKLFAYAEMHDLLDVKVYHRDVQVTLPSRTPKEDRYSIILRDAPVNDASRWQYMHTTHDCQTTRYLLGPGDLHLFCAHEVAAYLGFTKHMLLLNKEETRPKRKEQNRSAFYGNPFVVPSEGLVRFYGLLDTHVGIKEGRRRHLNMAEKEPLAWIFARDAGELWKKDTKPLRDYVW